MNITVNVPEGMCFIIVNDDNPTIQGQYQSQEFQMMNKKIKTYKAITNVTITTSGSVAYWKC